MEIADIWNVIILFIQALILIGQLILSHRINKQTISREKGYFLIEKSNIFTMEGDQRTVRDTFELKKDGGIGFHAIKADVILRSLSYSVDGVIYETTSPIDGFFTEDNRFNKLTISFRLKEADLQKEYLDVKFIFNLQNTVGYQYTETVDIRFTKMKNISWYKIVKYNMFLDR